MLEKEALIPSTNLKRSCASIAAILVMCATGFAEEGSTDSAAAVTTLEKPASSESARPGKKIEISGYGAIESGEIEAGHYGGNINAEIYHLWLGHVYAGLAARAKVNDHFSTLLSLESRIWYNTSPLSAVRDNSTFGAPMQNFDITITNAMGMISFGNKETFGLDIDIGRFEYKYNPQAQDLGEYLFRTGCYPAYIETNFDLPLARLNGLLLSVKLFNFLRQDILVTTMSDIEPFHSFNFSYVADAAVGKVFDVGAGISFDNMFSVDRLNDMDISPHDYAINGYLKSPGYVDARGDTIPGDTGFYTYAGIKLMARFMFAPLKFFDLPFFGENDGVFYAEAAVLGVQNYPRSNAVDTNSASNNSNPYGYDNILQKIPVTLGFLVPTCKVFDVLSIEGEWFGSRYPDNYISYTAGLSATPTVPGTNETSYDYAHDDWKWAIYGKKTILGGLSIIGLVGRDHMRTETYIKKYQDYESALIRNNQWYWMLKLKYSF